MTHHCSGAAEAAPVPAQSPTDGGFWAWAEPLHTAFLLTLCDDTRQEIQRAMREIPAVLAVLRRLDRIPERVGARGYEVLMLRLPSVEFFITGGVGQAADPYRIAVRFDSQRLLAHITASDPVRATDVRLLAEPLSAAHPLEGCDDRVG